MGEVDAMSKPSRSIRHMAGLGPVVSALLGVALPCAPALSADEPNLLKDPFFVALGTYLVNADTDLELKGDAGEPGTPINWNRTFGEGSLTRFRLDAQWRFGDSERHKLRALWFSSNRSSNKTTDREIEWGGETFPVNTKVKGDLKYDIYELSYEYAFLRRETYELSASIGAYYVGFDSRLSGTITAEGGGTNTREVSRDGSFDVPLPVLGLRGQWLFPYNLSLDVSGQYFTAAIDQYDGDLQNYRATLTWQPNKWVGMGLGYDWFSADLDVDASKFNGSVNWTFSGPMIYYSVSF
jgi:hypothetical protein